MYAIRKPCHCSTATFKNPRYFKVHNIYNDVNEISLYEIGMWDLHKFIVVKTLKQANKIIKTIKEKNNEQN